MHSLALPVSLKSSFHPFTPACQEHLRHGHGGLCSQTESWNLREKKAFVLRLNFIKFCLVAYVIWPLLDQSLCLGREAIWLVYLMTHPHFYNQSLRNGDSILWEPSEEVLIRRRKVPFMANQIMNANSWVINLSSGPVLHTSKQNLTISVSTKLFLFLKVQIKTENTSLWWRTDSFLIDHQAECFGMGFTSALAR